MATETLVLLDNNDMCVRDCDFYVGGWADWAGIGACCSAGIDQNIGFRFRCPIVPRAIITAGYMQLAFKRESCVGSSDIKIKISGELAAESAEWDDADDYDARVRTTNYAEWERSTWPDVGEYMDTSSLVDVLQEIVNQNDYEQWNYVTIFLENNGTLIEEGAFVYVVIDDDTGPKFYLDWEAPFYESDNTIKVKLKKTTDSKGYRFKMLKSYVPCDEPDYFFKMGLNPNGIVGGTANEFCVRGGVGPFTWAIDDDTILVGSSETEEGVNLLQSSIDTELGDKTLTITDSCGTEISGTVTCISRPTTPALLCSGSGGHRNGVRAAAIGNDIYLGFGKAIPFDYPWRSYNVETRNWTQRTSLNILRQKYLIASSGGKIYLGGGYSMYAAVKDWHCYDPDTDSWTTLTDMPVELQSGAAIDGKVYGLSRLTSDCYEYDIATDVWTQKADRPAFSLDIWSSPLSNAVCSLGGYLYVVHSTASYSYEPENFFRYDPNTNTWETMRHCETRNKFTSNRQYGAEDKPHGGSLVAYNEKLIFLHFSCQEAYGDPGHILEYLPDQNLWSFVRFALPAWAINDAWAVTIGDSVYSGWGEYILHYLGDPQYPAYIYRQFREGD